MTKNSYPKIYSIYAGDQCIASDVPEEEFESLWQTVRGMVGLMQTSYSEEDLYYEEWIDQPMNEIENDPTAQRLLKRMEEEKAAEDIKRQLS